MNVIIVAVVVGIISSLITAKIITAHYIKLLGLYVSENLKNLKDIVRLIKSLSGRGE